MQFYASVFQETILVWLTYVSADPHLGARIRSSGKMERSVAIRIVCAEERGELAVVKYEANSDFGEFFRDTAYVSCF